MSNILGLNGAPLGINGAPIAFSATDIDTSDATISSNSQLLYPYTSYGNGIKYTGSIQSLGATTYYPSTSDQTISSGVYLSGTQTVKGVLLTNLSAGNIKKDVVVKVGDSADDDRVTSITGTYTGATLYSVGIFLTNPSSPGDFDYFDIWERVTTDGWQSTTGDAFIDDNVIGSISSPTGTTIVKIDASSYGFYCGISGGPNGEAWASPYADHFTCTGGVTYAGFNEHFGYQLFQVTGDGTVIIDGIIWNDD